MTAQKYIQNKIIDLVKSRIFDTCEIMKYPKTSDLLFVIIGLFLLAIVFLGWNYGQMNETSTFANSVPPV